MDYTVYSSWFGEGHYSRMASVLEHTVDMHCPNGSFRGDRLRDVPEVSENIKQLSPNNLAKLCSWTQFLNQTGKPVAFLDADTFVVNDLEPIWDKQFDVAYCWRPGRRPLIGGVIFARPTIGAKRFFGEWVRLACQKMLDPLVADPLMNQFGGPNQACLNELTRNGRPYCKLERIPADPWNLCDEVWGAYDESTTKIVHLKGDLREEVFAGNAQNNEQWHPIVRRWLELLMETYE